MGCCCCCRERCQTFRRHRQRRRILSEYTTRLRSNDPTLREIDVSCWKVTNAQLRKLSAAMANNHYLERLDLQSNLLTDKGVDYLAEALRTNRRLKELWLGRNKISEQGVDALAQALCRNAGLERLSLEKIGPQAVAIIKCFGRNRFMERLYLGQNELGDEGCARICDALRKDARTNQIKILSLNDNQIGDKGAEALGKMMRTVSNVECLNLRHNRIDNEGAAALASALRKNGYKTVTMLRLGYNQIDDQGASYLSDALVDNHTLEKLDLEGNAIGVAGAQSLGRALEMNSALTVLSLGYNSISNKYESSMDWLNYKVIGDDGAIALADALKVNTNLKVLGLERDGIKDDGMIALAKALRVNDSLRTIHLDESTVTERSMEELTDALRVNHTFHRFGGLKTELQNQKELRRLMKINRDCMDAAMAREQKYQEFGYEDGKRANGYGDYYGDRQEEKREIKPLGIRPKKSKWAALRSAVVSNPNPNGNAANGSRREAPIRAGSSANTAGTGSFRPNRPPVRQNAPAPQRRPNGQSLPQKYNDASKPSSPPSSSMRQPQQQPKRSVGASKWAALRSAVVTDDPGRSGQGQYAQERQTQRA